MLRNIGAVISGIIGGVIAVGLINKLGHNLYGAAEYVDQDDQQAMIEFTESLPIEAFLFVILASSVGAFMAGLITSRIAENNHYYLGLVSGFMIFIATLITALSIPGGPGWLLPVSLIATALMGIAGAKLGSR